MENAQSNNPSDHLSQLEARIYSLATAVERLEQAMAEMRTLFVPGGGQPLPDQAPPRTQLFCPHCQGGNPPHTVSCQWCGLSLGAQPHSGNSSNAAPQPAVSAATPATSPVEGQAQSVGFQWEEASAPPPSGSATTHEVPPGVTARLLSWQFPRSLLDLVSSAEFWLNKVGIVLFLFGVAFLFKYAVDRAWLTEEVRVGIGLTLGTMLLGFGLRFHKGRRAFSQVLLGGSIVTYYITGYAAYQLFPGLQVPYEAAFTFMFGVTVLAFILSVRYDDLPLALAGLTGGLLTPFVLYHPDLHLFGLVIYTCIVVGGAVDIYFHKGWRSLLWASFAGMWLILYFGGYANELRIGPWPTDERWVLQGGVAFALVAFWLVPVLREVLSASDEERWPRPSLEFLGDASLQRMAGAHVHILAATTPLLALILSRQIWGASVVDEMWGVFTIAGAAAYGAVAWALRSYDATLAYTHAMVAIGLLSLGILQLFEGDMLVLSLAVEAAALRFIAHRMNDKGTAIAGHALFGFVGTMMAVHFLNHESWVNDLPPLFNSTALTYLAVIALTFAVSFIPGHVEVGITYRSVAYVAMLAWLAGELHEVGPQHSAMMLAWAIYGVLLVFSASYMREAKAATATSIAALVTFGATAGLFAERMSSGHVGLLPILNEKAAYDLAAIALAVLASFLARTRVERILYHSAIHTAVLALLWRELFHLRDGDAYTLLAWAAYGTLLLVVAHFTEDRIAQYAAWAVSAACGTWLLSRIALGLILRNPDDLAIFNPKGMAHLAVIALGVVGFALARRVETRIAYGVWLHFAFLGWLWQELGLLGSGNGNGYVSIAWGA